MLLNSEFPELLSFYGRTFNPSWRSARRNLILFCVLAFNKWGHPQWISPSCIIQPRAAQSLWPIAHRSLSLWVTKGEHTRCNPVLCTTSTIHPRVNTCIYICTPRTLNLRYDSINSLCLCQCTVI